MPNRDDVIRMAREAGFTVGYGSPALEKHERFAQLVAAHEREACAAICDVPLDVDDWEVQCGAEGRQLCNDLAAAIRARGNA